MTAMRLPTASRDEVYNAINGERDYQDGWKDPTLTDSSGLHSNVEFLVYIQDYVAEALHVASRRPDPEARVQNTHALRKIAAMAVAAMEQNGVFPRQQTDNLAQRHTG